MFGGRGSRGLMVEGSRSIKAFRHDGEAAQTATEQLKDSNIALIAGQR